MPIHLTNRLNCLSAAFCLLALLLTTALQAQDDRPQEFTTGQRVEVNDGVRWRPGTVQRKIQYRPDAFDYEVAADAFAGMPASLRRVAPDGAHIRPGGGTAPRPSGPLPASVGGPIPVPCAAKLLLNPRTKGRPASEALFRDVIKASWDENDDPYKGVVVLTFNSSTVGAPYRWAPGADLQVLGLSPKMVYPVQVTYTTCATTDASWTLRRSTSPTTYSCYLDEETNDWTCAIRKAGGASVEYIPKPGK